MNTCIVIKFQLFFLNLQIVQYLVFTKKSNGQFFLIDIEKSVRYNLIETGYIRKY